MTTENTKARCDCKRCRESYPDGYFDDPAQSNTKARVIRSEEGHLVGTVPPEHPSNTTREELAERLEARADEFAADPSVHGIVQLLREAASIIRASDQGARVDELTAALQSEWESNHDEHCSNFPNPDCESFGGSKECYWPRPKALEPAQSNTKAPCPYCIERERMGVGPCPLHDPAQSNTTREELSKRAEWESTGGPLTEKVFQGGMAKIARKDTTREELAERLEADAEWLDDERVNYGIVADLREAASILKGEQP